MIFCCGTYHKKIYEIFPLDTKAKINQRLEVAFCEKHKDIICELSFYDTFRKKFDTFRPKRKNVSAFIAEIKSKPYQTFSPGKIRQGTKSNMSFVFGVNEENEKEINQYSVDFNGQKTKIKTIRKPN